MSKDSLINQWASGILEAECEDLAWKLEHANEYSIAELKQSQSAAARSRLNLVKTSSISSWLTDPDNSIFIPNQISGKSAYLFIITGNTSG